MSKHPVLLYSAYRVAILLASFAASYLLGLRGWWWLLLSVALAGAVSYLALPRQRDAAAASVAARDEARGSRQARRGGVADLVAEDEAHEDAVLDAEGLGHPDRT